MCSRCGSNPANRVLQRARGAGRRYHGVRHASHGAYAGALAHACFAETSFDADTAVSVATDSFVAESTARRFARMCSVDVVAVVCATRFIAANCVHHTIAGAAFYTRSAACTVT